MAVVEMGGRPERDEELAAVRIGTGVGHRQYPGFAVTKRGVELVPELVPGSPGAGAEAIPALDHESVDDTVERDAVVERPRSLLAGGGIGPLPGAFSEADEVGHRIGGLLVEELDRKRSLGRVEQCVCAGLQ